VRGGLQVYGAQNYGVYSFAQQNTKFDVTRYGYFGAKILYNTFSDAAPPRTALGSTQHSSDLLAALSGPTCKGMERKGKRQGQKEKERDKS